MHYYTRTRQYYNNFMYRRGKYGCTTLPVHDNTTTVICLGEESTDALLSPHMTVLQQFYVQKKCGCITTLLVHDSTTIILCTKKIARLHYSSVHEYTTLVLCTGENSTASLLSLYNTVLQQFYVQEKKVRVHYSLQWTYFT